MSVKKEISMETLKKQKPSCPTGQKNSTLHWAITWTRLLNRQINKSRP